MNPLSFQSSVQGQMPGGFYFQCRDNPYLNQSSQFFLHRLLLSLSNRNSRYYHVGCTEAHTEDSPGGPLPTRDLIKDEESGERAPVQKVPVAILVFTV